MIEKQGDFWEEAQNPNIDTLVCTVNGIIKSNGQLVMGKGIAKDFNQKFSGLALEWGKRTKSYGLICHVSKRLLSDYPTSIKDVHLISLPTKYNWEKPSDPHLIESSIQQLVRLADHLDLKCILMTRPGCGNGGLNWDDLVQQIQLDKYLDDRFIVISI